MFKDLMMAGAAAFAAAIGLFAAPQSATAFVAPEPPAITARDITPVWYDRYGNWHPPRAHRHRHHHAHGRHHHHRHHHVRPRHRQIVQVRRPGPDWCYYRGTSPRNGWHCR